MGEAILGADRVVVFLLDFDLPYGKKKSLLAKGASDKDHFWISPYKLETRILERRELKRAEMQRLLPALVTTVSVMDNHYGYLCHQPIHGLRVYYGASLLFETSICYECGNFFVTYPNHEAEWVSLSNGDLEKVLKELMPIPESEIKRFQVRTGGKTESEK